MKRSGWAGVLAVLWLAGGCCAHPGIFQQVRDSMNTVQSYYEPLLKENLGEDKVRRAVVAADTALLLAGELQSQWCPDVQAAEQLQLQVQEAEKLAQAARNEAQTGQ